jgi:formiminotetrahydrofolate cyclodeaminase
MVRETSASTCVDSPSGVVAAAARSAAQALRVVRGVLAIAARHQTAEGLAGLTRRAEGEAERLEHLAQEDGLVYAAYLRARKESDGEEAALRQAIQTPLEAARVAASGLDLCVETLGAIGGAIAADVRGAANLLRGAVHAILCTVDENLRAVKDEVFFGQIAAERRKLAERADYGVELARYL